MELKEGACGQLYWQASMGCGPRNSSGIGSAMRSRSNTVSGRKSMPATDFKFLGCGVYNCRDLSTLCFFSVPNQANLLPW